MDDILTLHCIETWGNRSRLGARPDLYYRQLSDLPDSITSCVEGLVLPASMSNIQALERENHHLTGDVQVSKSWKTPVGATANTYSKLEIKGVFNLILNFIFNKLPKLFLPTDYLVPYCRAWPTVCRVGTTPRDVRRHQCHCYATSVIPDDGVLVPVTGSHSLSVEYNVVAGSRYCTKFWVSICL